ncbi:MAG TPA: patatin-like phospholipase family protein [Microlunatus sp.]
MQVKRIIAGLPPVRMLPSLKSALRRRLTRRPEVTGLVISGGGARADFEIGAARYLYDRVGIRPDVIVGTSAGSFLAAVLAQSADSDGQRRSLAALERLWREMRSNDEMFAANGWFDILRRRGMEWAATEQQGQQWRSSIGHTLARVSTHLPIPTPKSRSDSTIGIVEIVSAVREIGRAGPEVESLLQGMSRERSLYRIGPLMDKVLGQGVFVGSKVPESGLTLRIAAVSLESGELRYVTERGALVDRNNQPCDDGPVDLTDAIRASCAIPAVFEPVRLGTDTYVDGGVRETLATRIAVEQLGVTKCYAIVANPAGVPPESSYQDADLMSVAVRATVEIMTDEELQDEVAGARRDGAIVIDPELDLHDILTVDPGLTALSMDYGYLRAAETVTGSSAAQHKLIKDAIQLRRDTWELERDVFIGQLEDGGSTPSISGAHAMRWIRSAELGSMPPVDLTDVEQPDLTELAGLKLQLRDLVAQIDSDLLPPGAHDWWRRFEGHSFDIPFAPTWTD